MSEIVDIVDVGIPGPMGDVTPEAIAARNAALTYRNEARVARDQSEDWRDQAEVFAGNAVEFQDSAMADLLGNPASHLRGQFIHDTVNNYNDIRLMASLYYANRPIVFAGSSTTAAGIYVQTFVDATSQNLRQSRVQEKGTPSWTGGVSAYNYGIGGRRSDNYLSGSDTAEIIALNPKLIVHAVGANDWRAGVSPETVANNIVAKMAELRTANNVQVYVHQHARMDASDATYSWGDYLTAMQVATENIEDVVVVDISSAFARAGVKTGGSNFLGLMSADNVHLTTNGQIMMGQLLAQSFGMTPMRVPVPVDYSDSLVLPNEGTAERVNVEVQRLGNVINVNINISSGVIDVVSGVTYTLFSLGTEFMPVRQAWGVAWGSAGTLGLCTVRTNGTVAIMFHDTKTVSQLQAQCTWLQSKTLLN